MALGTLLDYLIDQKLKCNLVIGDQIIINETAVKSYDMKENCCWIFTEEGHKVKLDLAKFRKIKFDAAPYEPTNPIKMNYYLHKLQGNEPFNIYLETSNDMFIAGFYGIGDAG